MSMEIYDIASHEPRDVRILHELVLPGFVHYCRYIYISVRCYCSSFLSNNKPSAEELRANGSAMAKNMFYADFNQNPTLILVDLS